MDNPCNKCLVQPACDKSRHCQELYDYENKMVTQWYQKEAGRVLANKNDSVEEAWKAITNYLND